MSVDMNLSPSFDLALRMRRFPETATYQADVITVGRNVSGGGTRYRKLYRNGFTFRIRNDEDKTRSYFVMMTLYRHVKQKLVARTITLRSDPARPGHSVEIDVALSHGERPGNLFLDEFRVIDTDNVRVETHRPEWDLMHIALAQMPVPLRVIRTVVRGGLTVIGLALLAVFAVLAVIAIIGLWQTLHGR